MVKEFHKNPETTQEAVHKVLTTAVKLEVQRQLMKTFEHQHQIDIHHKILKQSIFSTFKTLLNVTPE